MPETRMRPLIYRWLALLGAVGLLHLCGRGPLAGPSLTRLSTLVAWTRSRPPAEEAVTVIRLLALGAGGYLLIVVSIAILGRIAGHGPTLAWAAQLTPPCLRRRPGTGDHRRHHDRYHRRDRRRGRLPATAHAPLGRGRTRDRRRGPPHPVPPHPVLPHPVPPPVPPHRDRSSAGPAPRRLPAPQARPSAGPGPRPLPPLPSSAHRSVPTGPAGTGSTASTAPTSPTGTGSTGSTAPTGPTGTGSTGAAGPTVAPADHPGRRVAGRAGPRPARRALRPASSRGAGPTTYVVRPGDDFWSIAAAQVGSAAGPADGTAVAAYWRVLIQANLKNLPVPGQPDLLFPGDRLRLPRLP